MTPNRTTICDRMTNLIVTGEYSDVTFVMKDRRKIYGHKLLFKIASPVFAAMLNGKWSEKDVIEIIDIEFDAFKTMTHYIYTDEIKLNSVSDAAAVFKAANKYDLLHLEKVAEEYIHLNLNVPDVIEIFELSKLYNKTEIEEACTLIIKQETAAVLDSAGFLDCNLETLKAITNYQFLNVDEIKLFTSIEKWLEYNAIKRGLPTDILIPGLKPVVNKIRFLSMNVDEFVQGPYKSKLLSDDERQNLFTNLTETCSKSIPHGFSIETEPRMPSDIYIAETSRRNGKYIKLTARWKKEKVSNIEPYIDHCSSQFMFNNFTWRISVKQVNLIGRKFLDLNLICDSDKKYRGDNDWLCDIKYTFKILARKTKQQDLISECRRDLFNKDNNICGWNPFILWSTFIHPNLALIEDDSVIIEVELMAVDV